MKNLTCKVLGIVLLLAGYSHSGDAQSKVAQKITKPESVKVKLDFPGESRKGKKGKGWSANLELLEKPIEKVALVSFFVFDPGYTSSFKVSGSTSTTTYIKKRSTGAISADVAVGSLDKVYQQMKEEFASNNMELLMPWEFLDTDTKKAAYQSFKLEKEDNFRNWLQTIGSSNHNMVYGYPEGFSLIDISAEAVANYEKKGLFTSRSGSSAANVYLFNKDSKMTETLGYDLATSLGVDAVLISYMTIWAPANDKIVLDNVNLTMFGPNPIMPQESNHGAIPHVKGQFYAGVRTVIDEEIYNFNKKDESSQQLNFTGFEHIYAALMAEMFTYINERTSGE